jgi:hypothetical protein
MKTLTAIATLATLASSAFAQGTIGFQNTVATEFYIGSVSPANVVPADTTTIDIGLFWSPTAFNTLMGNLGGIVQFGSFAGQIAGNAAFVVPGVSGGDSEYYQVFAWDAAYGNSLAGLQACVAAGGLFGASSAGPANTIYGLIGNSILLTANTQPAVGPPVFNTSGNSFGKTIISPTPEPTTIALGGLGAAAMMLFRRRKTPKQAIISVVNAD